MKAGRPIAVAALIALTGQYAASHAAIIGINRAGVESVTFTDPAAFSDAEIQISVATTYSGNTNDTRHIVFAFTSPSFNVSVTGDANMQVSGITLLASSVEYDISSVNGTNGLVTIAYDRFVNQGTTLTTGVFGGLHALTVSRNQTGNLDDGFPATLALTMPGDWSTVGTTTGQHQLLSLDNDWVPDQDFTFGGGLTTVSAHIDSYLNDGAHDSNLRFRLFGARAVPEPGTVALLALALAGFGVARRGR